MARYTLKDIEEDLRLVKPFTSQELIEARDQLKVVLEQALNQEKITFEKFEKDSGICRNWSLAGFWHSFVFISMCSSGWPHSRTPGRRNAFPVRVYGIADHFWSGDGLKYRLSLMRYMIKRLNDMIRHRRNQENRNA